MDMNDAGTQRKPYARYVVTMLHDDDSGWEIGWDRHKGAFFVQQFGVDEDNTVTEVGPKLFEPTALERLGDHIGRPIPEDVAQEVHADAAAFPPPGATTTNTVSDWITTVYENVGIEPRWSLPADPVLEVLYEHQAEWGNRRLTSVAAGLRIDQNLAAGMVNGSVTELNIDQIAHVCEALRCSPFDMWGTDDGRSILHAYGPELWPKHIEPLDAGLDPPERHPVTETGPANLYAVPDHLGRPEHSTPGTTGPDAASPPEQPPTGPGWSAVVTAYRITGLLAVTPDGYTVHVSDPHIPLQPGYDYHYTFEQLNDPVVMSLPRLDGELTEAGDGVDRRVAALASSLRENVAERDNISIDMVRFGSTSGTGEEWLGWHPDTQTWESWDDPRRYYAREPTDVLNPGPHVEPDSWTTVATPAHGLPQLATAPQAIEPHHPRGDQAASHQLPGHYPPALTAGTHTGYESTQPEHDGPHEGYTPLPAGEDPFDPYETDNPPPDLGLDL